MEYFGKHRRSLLRVDNADRMHLAANLIDERFYESVDGEQYIQESETDSFVELVEEVYNWNPDKAATMTTQEFEDLVVGYEQLLSKAAMVEDAHAQVCNIRQQMKEARELPHVQNESETEITISALQRIARDSLWGGEMISTLLAQSKEDTAILEYEKSQKSGSGSIHAHDDLKAIENTIERSLNAAVHGAAIERDASRVMADQFVMQHAEPSSKAYKAAKNRLKDATRYSYVRQDEYGSWGEYEYKVTKWHTKNRLALEPHAFIWERALEDLESSNEIGGDAKFIVKLEYIDNLDDLADNLDDFHARSIDDSVALRLIEQGESEKVTENFHVFTGNTSAVVEKIMNRKGFDYVLANLCKFHNLSDDFMQLLFDEWDLAVDHWNSNGGSYDGLPLGLHEPTEKMDYLIDNLNSFTILGAGVAYEIVTRMYADRDHGAASLRLIRTLMAKIDCFETFDHLDFAKHIAREESIPHHGEWQETLYPILEALDLPNTPEAQLFITEVTANSSYYSY